MRSTKARPVCKNCGGLGPHFVPPSVGERGYFICDRNDLETQPKEGEQMSLSKSKMDFCLCDEIPRKVKLSVIKALEERK